MDRDIYSVLIVVTALFVAVPVSGEVASSTNYQLEFDSVNIGGVYSTSSSYSLEDTVGEVATGRSSSTNYQVQAGYQQSGDVTLSITSPDDVTLGPAINGLLGGNATGNASWTVTTNNSAGYSLSIEASTNPALSSAAASFSDYAPSDINPDYTWSVGSNASEFGFSPEGDDITNRYKDDGLVCGVGALATADTCWDGLSTSARIIASDSSANNPGGTSTTVKFQAEAGSDANQSAGAYTAVVTVTAIAL